MRKFRSLNSALKRIRGFLSRNRSEVLTDGVPAGDIPGMVSSDEKAFYAESAARYFGREGAIVDLGCWMGSTSIALAQGIISHGPKADNPKEKVLGFDTFQWETWMPAHIPYCLYEPGESFLPEARRVVREHGGGRVELIQADLGVYDWNGGPIKILLVDAMKNENLAIQIPRNFFPSLVPGGLLIQQDFKHYYTSWIHVLQYRLRQYFRFYRSVPWGTAAFEVIAPIPGEAIHRATESMIPDDEADASFRHSLDLVGADERANIAAAHVMHYLHRKRKDRALQVLELYRPHGILDKGEFPTVINLLGDAG